MLAQYKCIIYWTSGDMKMWSSCPGNYHWRKWDWYLEKYRKYKQYQRQYKCCHWCLQFKCLILECIILILEGSDYALYGCYFLQYIIVLQCLHSHIQSISFDSSLNDQQQSTTDKSFISQRRKMPMNVNNHFIISAIRSYVHFYLVPSNVSVGYSSCLAGRV